MGYVAGKRSALHFGVLGVFVVIMMVVLVRALDRLQADIEKVTARALLPASEQ